MVQDIRKALHMGPSDYAVANKLLDLVPILLDNARMGWGTWQTNLDN
jgi:hypothetical protein